MKILSWPDCPNRRVVTRFRWRGRALLPLYKNGFIYRETGIPNSNPARSLLSITKAIFRIQSPVRWLLNVSKFFCWMDSRCGSNELNCSAHSGRVPTHLYEAGAVRQLSTCLGGGQSNKICREYWTGRRGVQSTSPRQSRQSLPSSSYTYMCLPDFWFFKLLFFIPPCQVIKRLGMHFLFSVWIYNRWKSQTEK